MSKTRNIQQQSENKKTVYNRIKSVLAEKRKTNIELANELNVAEETISSWCTNTAQPSIKSLFRVALFLNVNPGDLLIKIEDFNIGHDSSVI